MVATTTKQIIPDVNTSNATPVIRLAAYDQALHGAIRCRDCAENLTCEAAMQVIAGYEDRYDLNGDIHLVPIFYEGCEDIRCNSPLVSLVSDR